MSQSEAAQPGWRRNFTILWLSQLVAMLGFSTAILFLPLFVRELVGSDQSAVSTAGLILGAAAITSAAAASLGGRLGDRLGHQRVVAFAAIALTLAGIWIALAVRAPEPRGATT